MKDVLLAIWAAIAITLMLALALWVPIKELILLLLH